MRSFLGCLLLILASACVSGPQTTASDFALRLVVTQPTLALSSSGSSSLSIRVAVDRDHFTAPVNLALLQASGAALPAGLSASLTPNPVTGDSATLTLTATGNAPIGDLELRLEGTAGPSKRTAQSRVQITAAPAITWVYCAKEYSGCGFSGLRDVRYLLNGQSTVKEFFGGLESCNNAHFDLPEGGSGQAVCAYASEYKTKTLSNPNPGMAGLGASVTVPLGDPGHGEARVQSFPDSGAPSDIGAFRTSCGVTHFGFDDPIVSPGKPGASHLHQFFGNALTDANSTADSLKNSGNSSCAGGILNRSAYWTPALIDGQGGVVLPSSQIFYYKTGYLGIKPDQVRAMPAGLRMIAGDKNATQYQANANWGCEEVYIGHKASLREVLTDPRCPPGNHLTLSVDFPQCWDGKNLDSPDHQNHMSNPVNGACPASHPVPLPVITINVRYLIPQAGATDWHLSSDMYDYARLGGGLSLHADWFNGWDPETEQTFITHCLNASKDCHGFLLGDGRILY